MVTAPDRRVMVRWMQTKGLSQRRALEAIRMSATVLRYQPRPDRKIELRVSIVALAQRHRRYGVGMIYLKLRQRGECVNYKRVERLYQLEKLQVHRRKRKKRDLTERHPLGRPSRRNEVWSMDFVFDRTANGRTLEVFDRPRRCDSRIRGGYPGTQHGWIAADTSSRSLGDGTRLTEDHSQ
jgi:putative transposase